MPDPFADPLPDPLPGASVLMGEPGAGGSTVPTGGQPTDGSEFIKVQQVADRLILVRSFGDMNTESIQRDLILSFNRSVSGAQQF